MFEIGLNLIFTFLSSEGDFIEVVLNELSLTLEQKVPKARAAPALTKHAQLPFGVGHDAAADPEEVFNEAGQADLVERF